MPVKRLKCKQCGEYQDREKVIRVPAGNFCSHDHMMEFAREKQEAQRARALKKANADTKKKEKAQRASDRKRKEALKTAGDYIKEAQAAVNRYIRARDFGRPCISCGNLSEQKFGGTMECGHYRSRGSASHLRFNLLNMSSQCVRCNRNLSGNVVEYRKGLVKKIGLERVEQLENDNAPRKFTIDYLKRLKRIFNKRARWYEKRNAP